MGEHNNPKGPQYTAQQFIDAIANSNGIITAIAKRVGCTWHTAKKYIDTYPTIRAAYDDECESILDLAESKLHKAIIADDLSAIKYILSTKGKHRGYTERQEVSGPGGGDIRFHVTYGDGKDGDGKDGDGSHAGD